MHIPNYMVSGKWEIQFRQVLIWFIIVLRPKKSFGTEIGNIIVNQHRKFIATYQTDTVCILKFQQTQFSLLLFSLTTSIGSCTEAFCHKIFIGTNFVDSKVVVVSEMTLLILTLKASSQRVTNSMLPNMFDSSSDMS